MGTFSFGEKVASPYGDIVIESKSDKTINNSVVYISIKPLLSLAEYYREKINVAPLVKILLY